MFWTKWPSSGVQFVVGQDSTAQSNVVFFPLVIFGYVGCTWLLLILFSLLVVLP
jgi:hypothetical protein